MEWRYQKFDEISGRELYEILKLRVNVFIVEQDCPYPEIDGNDFDAIHVTCRDEEGIAAYSRLLPSGVKYKTPSIGRVIVRDDQRGTGLGHILMERAIREVLKQWEPNEIFLQAQTHLERFYKQHKFNTVSEPYDDDGIPHIDMIYQESREEGF